MSATDGSSSAVMLYDSSGGIPSSSRGGNQGHTHNIPYISMFIWRRTA